VLLRALNENGRLDTPEGHVAVGWLVVEDLLTVLVLVLLPPLAAGNEGSGSLLKTAGIATLKLVVLSVIVLLAGARVVPWLFLRVARLRSRELFTLTVLVMAICIATVSYVTFGASMALGAFLAGMVVGQSQVSHEAAADIVPLRDAFAVLFFVAVGMLFDFHAVLAAPGLLVGVTAVILVVKPLVAMLVVLICGHSLRTGLTVAGGLAQIGEFSFILGESAKSLKLLPGDAHNVLVAAAIISIALNPLLFKQLLALESRLPRWPWLAERLARGEKRRNAKAAQLSVPAADESSAVRAIVVGYGPVGRTLTRLLRDSGIQPTIIETNVDTVLELQTAGQPAVFGDASHHGILAAAGLKTAAYLVVTVPKVETSLAIIHTARDQHPGVRILARAAYLNQREALEQAGAAMVRSDEAEAAVALAGTLMEEIKIPQQQIENAIGRLREELEAKIL
jgi:CPA2 family monovalent cation:H+ antiporter-2